ncbi:MAG: hypothetical protein DMD83_24735 [Candidatus Rokuibacteriota bacterium]|nr:MAG: hypothetical protein DMD83_24735 [Candidatus Rokubacteria bacterium]
MMPSMKRLAVSSHHPSDKGGEMNVTLWILQVVVGVFFAISGHGKAFNSWESMQRIPWIDGVSLGLMRFIGWSELLGGIGPILPAATKIKPVLTPMAAVGLTLVMILATGFHVMRRKYMFVILTAAVGAITAFIAYGRFALKPIQ